MPPSPGLTFLFFSGPYKGRSNVRLGPDVLLRGQSVARSHAFINLREVWCSRRRKPTPGPDFRVTGLRCITATQSDICSPVSAPWRRTPTSRSPTSGTRTWTLTSNTSSCRSVETTRRSPPLSSSRFWTKRRLDIITDGFSLQTCCDIISLLDTDGSSRLGLLGEDADVPGFQLNSTVIQEIVARYTDRSYAIDFDRFIGCLIRLEMLFRMFRTLDPARPAAGKPHLSSAVPLLLADIHDIITDLISFCSGCASPSTDSCHSRSMLGK
ncbi:calpain-1 catalytic subunit [Haplochromis burtoni]|uniref:calpain-1 catalytic subunit n=1 Tax=Haplochromis burtoni TaxID=8153 RepID=UPI001C2D8F0D|nr:calpain-1 catalytic subunit [Haplochromis burtoni]